MRCETREEEQVCEVAIILSLSPVKSSQAQCSFWVHGLGLRALLTRIIHIIESIEDIWTQVLINSSNEIKCSCVKKDWGIKLVFTTLHPLSRSLDKGPTLSKRFS